MTNNHEYSLKTKSVRGVASNTQAIYSSWAPLVKVSSQNHPECFSSDPKIPHIPTKEDQVGPKRWQTSGRKVADRWQKQDPFSGTYFCHLSATFLPPFCHLSGNFGGPNAPWRAKNWVNGSRIRGKGIASNSHWADCDVLSANTSLKSCSWGTPGLSGGASRPSPLQATARKWWR